MKKIFFISLSLIFATPVFSAIPDLTQLNSQDILKLGLSGTQKIEGQCYEAHHVFCVVGSDPRYCKEDEKLERETNIRLENAKLVPSSRTKDEQGRELIIYKPTPVSDKIEEKDLYTLRRTKQSSDMRLFVTLTQTSCPTAQETSLELKKKPPLPVLTAEGKAISTIPANTLKKEEAAESKQTDSIAIPSDGRKRDAALKFLLQQK